MAVCFEKQIRNFSKIQREWHTLIGNQLGTKLKVLRTDNDLEFVSEQFNEFCRKVGIKRHKTIPHTP